MEKSSEGGGGWTKLLANARKKNISFLQKLGHPTGFKYCGHEAPHPLIRGSGPAPVFDNLGKNYNRVTNYSFSPDVLFLSLIIINPADI